MLYFFQARTYRSSYLFLAGRSCYSRMSEHSHLRLLLLYANLHNSQIRPISCQGILVLW